MSSYKSICVVHSKDIEALYPLIASYVSQPELALTVNELVLNDNDWPSRRMPWAFDDGAAADTVDDHAHAALES